jgi:DEAD/DEAH box helicase domain-containing protein
MKYEIIFDVETKNLFSDVGSDDPGKLGVSIVSAYIRNSDDSGNETRGEMISFWEKDIPKFLAIIKSADRIIGFNTKHFDIPALEPYATFPLKPLPHFDIMEFVKNGIGKRLPLDLLARDTLGTEKIDVGTNAVRYYRLGDEESLKKLQKYCESDVMITKQLYDFGRTQKHLKYKDKWNNIQTIMVDFSYPIISNISTTRQINLF